jgi:tetratricopeptide (TPR) repeat protein
MMCLVRLYILQGKILKKEKNYVSCMETLNNCIIIYEKNKLDDGDLLVELYDLRGMIFRRISDNFQALNEFEKGYAIVKVNHRSPRYTRIKYYRHLASIHQTLENYDKAMDFFMNAVGLLDESSNLYLSKLSDCFMNMGIIGQKTAKYEIAKSNFNKALELEKQITGEENIKISKILMNLGKTLGFLSQIKEGVESLDTAFGMLKRIGKSESIDGVKCLYDKGLLLEMYGDKKRAKDIFNQSFTLAKKISDKEDLENIILELEGKLKTTFIA